MHTFNAPVGLVDKDKIYYPIDPDDEKTAYISYKDEKVKAKNELPGDAYIVVIREYNEPDGKTYKGKEAILKNIAELKV